MGTHKQNFNSKLNQLYHSQLNQPKANINIIDVDNVTEDVYCDIIQEDFNLKQELVQAKLKENLEFIKRYINYTPNNKEHSSWN